MFTESFLYDFFGLAARARRKSIIEPTVSATTDGRILISLGSSLPSVRLTPANALILIDKLTTATDMALHAANKDKK